MTFFNKYMYLKKTLLALSIFGLFVVTAQAQTDGVSEQTSAFRDVAYVVTDFIEVPTVVEIPITTYLERQTFAVNQKGTDLFTPYYFIVKNQTTEIPLSVSSTNGIGKSSNILDGKYQTNIDFASTDGYIETAQIVLTAPEEVVSSEIVFTFAQNVARPMTVALYAIDSTGVESVVVAKKRMDSNRLLFPETQAMSWRIVMTYLQPLRIAEVSLRQSDVERNASRSLRFLAQPGEVYAIYMNPDRPTSIATTEAGDLRSDKGVKVFSGAFTVRPNARYVIADVDTDGVPDQSDNCVSISNTDQIDIDGNGRGDVCDDFDRDGRINSEDNCLDDPNRYQKDEDGDGIGDVCDTEESRLTEKYAWIPWVGMGFAGLVILAMFMTVLNRSKKEGVPEESIDYVPLSEKPPVEPVQ